MKTINAMILWLELRDVSVWARLARRWRWSIPAVAWLANTAHRCGWRGQAWQLAAFGWEVWDNVPIDDSTAAWHETMRLMPWTGGCDTAWRAAHS
jgi:hypothetical protein